MFARCPPSQLNSSVEGEDGIQNPFRGSCAADGEARPLLCSACKIAASVSVCLSPHCASFVRNAAVKLQSPSFEAERIGLELGSLAFACPNCAVRHF